MRVLEYGYIIILKLPHCGNLTYAPQQHSKLLFEANRPRSLTRSYIHQQLDYEWNGSVARW